MNFFNKDNLKFSILNNPHEIQLAKALLYNIYIVEQKWKFNEDNPSGLRIIKSFCNNNILTDNYDENSIWFGGIHNEEVIESRLTPCLKGIDIHTNVNFYTHCTCCGKLVGL